MRAPSIGLGVVALVACVVGARASDIDPPSIAEGRRLLAENNCNGACHQSYAADNDPLSLYSPTVRKMRNRQQLSGQVKMCVSRLGSMIFPEELDSVTAALDHDYYRFK